MSGGPRNLLRPAACSPDIRVNGGLCHAHAHADARRTLLFSAIGTQGEAKLRRFSARGVIGWRRLTAWQAHRRPRARCLAEGHRPDGSRPFTVSPAAAHILAQDRGLAGRRVYAFTRRGDTARASIREIAGGGVGWEARTNCAPEPARPPPLSLLRSARSFRWRSKR
jgi:hypothetical protein